MTSPIRLAILGATGSIGRQALDVVRAHPDRLRVVALGANRNADDLRTLATEFPAARTALGPNALVALATDADADLVLVATPASPACERPLPRSTTESASLSRTRATRSLKRDGCTASSTSASTWSTTRRASCTRSSSTLMAA